MAFKFNDTVVSFYAFFVMARPNPVLALPPGMT